MTEHDDERDGFASGDGCIGSLAASRSGPSRETQDLRRARKVRPARARHDIDPDRDVLQLVERGEVRQALHALMDRHGPAVYRYCCGALRDAALAEDVQQQVFIEAFRDLPGFAGRSSVRTWLFAIARHRALDAAKAKTRADARVEIDSLADAPDPGPAPSELLDDVRLREILAACLDELGEKVRTALLLRYQQGFTFEQMAEICGDKPGTLQVRVARALPALRARLRLRTGGRF